MGAQRNPLGDPRVQLKVGGGRPGSSVFIGVGVGRFSQAAVIRNGCSKELEEVVTSN